MQKRSEELKTKGPLRLFVNKAVELWTMVDEMENEDEFHQLVLETRSAFYGDYHGKSEYAWQRAVKNFFRRSVYYADIFEGKIVSIEATFHNYREAFQRREIQVSYLAPMEFVYFAERTMDFGTFHIRRFSSEELSTILQNSINEVFYPWAAVDVKQLQNYWFIHLIEAVHAPKLGWIHVNLSDIDRVGIEYTEHPKVIEFALQQLALFDWQADWWKKLSAHRHEKQDKDLEKGWLRFSIPFVLRVDDHLLDSPRPAPDISKLETEPFIDARTGEEIGEAPVVYIHFDKSETDAFKAFIQRTGNLLASLRAKQNGWQFLEVALGNFIRAFFSEGLEQMLWHITALEALLGEKGEGVTDRLARRIASILGKSEKERKAIRKQFKELYDFRSDLVHGNPFQKQTYVGHLRDARNLSRRVLLWFLHYLCKIQAGIPLNHAAENVPTREDTLTLLDLDQNSRINLGWLIDIFPSEFPYVSEWVE
jgi:hypothetical protein